MTFASEINTDMTFDTFLKYSIPWKTFAVRLLTFPYQIKMFVL